MENHMKAGAEKQGASEPLRQPVSSALPLFSDRKFLQHNNKEQRDNPAENPVRRPQ
jgi:hypothetical protein